MAANSVLIYTGMIHKEWLELTSHVNTKTWYHFDGGAGNGAMLRITRIFRKILNVEYQMLIMNITVNQHPSINYLNE